MGVRCWAWPQSGQKSHARAQVFHVSAALERELTFKHRLEYFAELMLQCFATFSTFSQKKRSSLNYSIQSNQKLWKMHCTLFYPHLSYFLHFILYGKGNSESLPDLRNKHVAAMLLENFWIQINSKLVFWPKITVNFLLLSLLVELLLLLPETALISCVFFNPSEKHGNPWKPKVNVLMCLLSYWS